MLPENIKPEFTNNLEFYSNLVDQGHDEIFIFGAQLIIKGCEEMLKEYQAETSVV